MRSIRHILLASVLTVSAFSTVTFTSCKKDDDGCAVGYEGTDCKTLSITKFIKNWCCRHKTFQDKNVVGWERV